MTLISLILSFAIAAAILTFFTRSPVRRNFFISFLQYFAGVWFVFSGAVKAVDPSGTAIKMQQYFGEFERTLNGTFLAPFSHIFTWLDHYVLGFSIFVIVLEIILGVLIIIGHAPKTVTWIFLILNLFFLVLTGYTHLTAYVPSEVNFFDFSKWGEYVKTNMRVTDCGCFGDFLKLEPSVSFKKDLYILTPIAFLLLIFKSQFHVLFHRGIRRIIFIGSTLLTFAFCWYNTFLNEPVVDFRPFKPGVNILERKKAEEKALGDVKITDWKLKNTQTGELKTLSDADYMKSLKTYNETNGWKVLDQIKTEPAVAHSKISDFAVSDIKGDDVTETFLSEPNYMFVAVSFKMNSTESQVTVQIPDTVYKFDTLRLKVNKKDTFSVKKTLDHVGKREEIYKSFAFDSDYRQQFTKKINPLFEAAEKAGYKIAGLVPFDGQKKIDDFRHDTQSAYPFYTADNVVLETMMRSNPGVFLFKNGTIIQKWHINNLPTFSEIKERYLK